MKKLIGVMLCAGLISVGVQSVKAQGIEIRLGGGHRGIYPSVGVTHYRGGSYGGASYNGMRGNPYYRSNIGFNSGQNVCCDCYQRFSPYGYYQQRRSNYYHRNQVNRHQDKYYPRGYFYSIEY